jgi:cytochrome b561
MIKNTKKSFGSVSKFLHWTIALIMIGLLALGFLLHDYGSPYLYKVHKTIGFLVLLLVGIRLLWRIINPTPEYDNKTPKIMVFAVHSFHYLLYALMIIMPLSGFIASNAAMKSVSFLFLFDMPSVFEVKNVDLAKLMMQAHHFIALAILFVLSMHIIAALYHHYIRKDDILKRMLPTFFDRS